MLILEDLFQNVWGDEKVIERVLQGARYLASMGRIHNPPAQLRGKEEITESANGDFGARTCGVPRWP